MYEGGLDFLALDLNPDPRDPPPRASEAQRGSVPQPQESSASESICSPVVNTPPTPGIPEPGKYGSPAEGGTPHFNVDPKTGGLDFLSLNPILAPSYTDQIQALIELPRIEDQYGWENLSPEVQRFIRTLSRTQSVTKAAEHVGIKRTQLYNLRSRNEDFRKLWDLAIEHRADLIEDEAIRRAVKGVEEPVYYMGAICGYKRVYSDALLGKLLEGNMPEKYRTNHKVDVTGNLGIATLVLPATTSAEDWMRQNNGTIIDQLPENEYD